MIFSKTAITSLAFLDEEAGKALSASEQSELNNFLSSNKANVLPANVMNENTSEPYASVKTSKAVGEALVFDVHVEHK